MENMSYQIKSFMWEKLSLGGAELLIYALIYSFSQGECGMYYGTMAVLSRAAGVSASTVKRVLTKLCESGLIKKCQVGSRSGYRCCDTEEDSLDINNKGTLAESGEAVDFVGLKEDNIPLSSEVIGDSGRARYEYFRVGNEGVISMTAEQYKALLSLVDEESLTAYIRRLELLVVNKGYHINNPYKTLRGWIHKDARV